MHYPPTIKTAAIVLMTMVAVSLYAQADRMRGITMVAPPDEWTTPPVQGLEQLNAEWVGLVPYGFTRQGDKKVSYNLPWQWWGERKEGIKAAINMAHNNGIKVMLKPQVYIPGGWVGDMSFDREADWLQWEESYRTFILDWAQLADSLDVHMLCIATEYKAAVQQRPQFWTSLIKDIRAAYSGSLTYSANWDNYEKIPFWSDLDYVGVSAYFPLLEDHTPSVEDLTAAWQPIVKRLATYARKVDRQILFTEYGYMSVDGCAYQAWMIEKNLSERGINEKAQANAYEALLSTMSPQSWWGGGFLWKYFPHGQGHEGYPEKDYTPQGKLAEKIVAYWHAW